MNKHPSRSGAHRITPMTVGELLEWLSDRNPDFLVLLDASSQSLMIVNPRPGFCLPAEAEADENWSRCQYDREFLHDLHIKPG